MIAEKLSEKSKRQVLAESAMESYKLRSCGLHVREKT